MSDNRIRRSPSSSSSSSIRSGSVRSGPVEDDEEEERLKDLWRLAAQMTGDYVPHPLCRRLETETQLLQALEGATFEMPLPDAIDLVNEYGLATVEGALIRTLAHIKAGTVRKSRRGFLIANLRRNLAWTPDQVAIYVNGEWRKSLDRMRGSEDQTVAKIAREIEMLSGTAPENVTRMRRVV